MNHLIILKDNPDILDSLDIIKLCNKFVNATSYTSRRLNVFGKFEQEDLSSYNFEPTESVHLHLGSKKDVNNDDVCDENCDFAIDGNIEDEINKDVDDENAFYSFMENDILIEEV